MEVPDEERQGREDDFEVTTNTVYNRFMFNTKKQDAKESIIQFIQGLRDLFPHCGYGSHDQDDLLRDRLICGVRDLRIQASILAEAANHQSYTLERALIVAENKEKQLEDGNIEIKAEQCDQQLKLEKENRPLYNQRSLAASKCSNLKAKRKKLECEACNYSCYTKQLLAAHTMTAHGIETYCHKHVACSECLKVFLSPASLQAHSLLNHGKKQVNKIYSGGFVKSVFTCETCSYRSSTMSDLKAHVSLFHADTKMELQEAKLAKYRCEHCLFKALNATHLDQHISMAHSHVKRVLINCEFCDFSTMSKGQFIKHMTKEHKGAKGFMCETCGKKFSTDKSMEVHQKVVHENQKPYKCELCDYVAGQKASLVGHMQGVHENKKPHVCDHCGYSTVSKSTLNNHVRMVHEKRRPHVCSVCARTFASRHGLHTHVQLIHEQQTPHCCEVCGRRFKRKPELINHVRCVHEGKYHVCQICGHNFYSSRNLERHVLVVHEGQRPFACQCGQRFARKERLKHHAERCHGQSGGQPPSQQVVQTTSVVTETPQTIIIQQDPLQQNQHIATVTADGVATHQIIVEGAHPVHQIVQHHVEATPELDGVQSPEVVAQNTFQVDQIILQQQQQQQQQQIQPQQQQIQMQLQNPMQIQTVRHHQQQPTVIYRP